MMNFVENGNDGVDVAFTGMNRDVDNAPLLTVVLPALAKGSDLFGMVPFQSGQIHSQ